MFGGVNREDFLFELQDRRGRCQVDRQTARVTVLDIPAFESDYLSRFGFPDAAKLLVEEDLKRIYREADGQRLNTLTATSAYEVEDTVKGMGDDEAEAEASQQEDEKPASRTREHEQQAKPARQLKDVASEKQSTSIKASVHKVKPEVKLEDVSID